MGWVTTTLGAVLVVVVMSDLLVTAMSVSHGAGPVAKRLARTVWRGILRVHRRWHTPRLLVAGGPVVLVLIIVTWVVLLILGWSLVFDSPETLLTVEDGKAVPVLGRLRYSASIVIGRGSGGIRPSGDIYVALEPVAALTGMALLSLSIAFILPVVRGVVEKRTLAAYITMLGSTPAEILTNAWTGRDFAQLDLHMVALTPRVAGVAQSHLAYPVIHYFHSADTETALGPSLAVLDVALRANLLLDPAARIDHTTTEPLRRAVGRFLRTLRVAFIQPEDVPQDPVDDRLAETLAALREHGLPVSVGRDPEPSEDEVDRSRLMRGYLVHDGWEDPEPAKSSPAA